MLTQGRQYILRSRRHPNRGPRRRERHLAPYFRRAGRRGRCVCGARWARFGRLRRRAAGHHALSRRARGVQPAATSICAARLATRQARGHRQRLRSRASGWPGPAPAPPRGARECRRSSAVVRRSARSFYSLLLSAAHDKAHKPRSAAIRLISALRGSKGAVLQRGLCEHRASRPTFRKSRRLSVRLQLRRHRSAGCQPQQPATALEHRSRRWLWAPRRRFTRPRARTVSGDENLARRKCAEPLSRRTDVIAMPASLRCSTSAATIAVAVSSGQPGSKKTGGRQAEWAVWQQARLDPLLQHRPQ